MSIKEKALATVEITAKTALSVIPVGGALATSIYDSVKGNCLAKRQQKWQNELEERLSNVEKTLEQIGNNEMFTTALVKSTEIAMKTSSEEKMKYLSQAVYSTLEEINIDETKTMIFLNMIDKYTIGHIQLIKKYYEGYREEPRSDSLMAKLFNDIYSDSLIECLHDFQNTCLLSDLGIEFYEFIKIKDD